MEEKNYRLGWHLVVFLDVLGQREKFRLLRLPGGVEEHQMVQEVLRQTVGFVSNLRDRFQDSFVAFEAGLSSFQAQGKRVPRPQFQGFSDSFIVSVALYDEKDYRNPTIGIFSALSAASTVMLTALASQHALRGGIDVGLATEICPGEIYGTALERAYLLESKSAEYPRIVVGDELWKYWSAILEGFEKLDTESGRAMAELIRKQMELVSDDSDGRRILDYLGSGFATIAAPNYANNLVKPAYQFVLDQQAQAVSKGDVRLSGRYAILRHYFESRLPLWGLSA